MQPLAGQVAVVTGGGRGIGAAIGARLAELGASVVVCGRADAPLQETVKAICAAGGRGSAAVCDVQDFKSVAAVAAAVQRDFGRCDVLVNNAGIGAFGRRLHETEPEQWDAVLNTNLRGVFYCIRAFAPMMIAAGSGHIINISSLAGKNPVPRAAAYAASKWGLNGLTVSVAEELREHNVRVSVVCPGSVDTDLTGHAGKDKSRMLQADDVAHVVAMLVTQAPQSFASEILLRPTLKP